MTPKPARGVVALCLRLFGFGGSCLPPWGIYILPERMAESDLIRHEQIHWAQYQRMGVLRYYLTYVWQVIRYGYWNAPMEREARGE